MDYKHKSGAQKRKEREQKLQCSKKGSRTLFEFGLKHLAASNNENLSHSSSIPSSEPVPESDPITEPMSVAGSQRHTMPLADLTATTSEPVIGSNFDNPSTEITESMPISDKAPEPMSVPDLLSGQISSDLGKLCDKEYLSASDIEGIVKLGPSTMPKDLPGDGKRAFPRIVLFSKLSNGENVPRDWLSWSETQQSLYCFPCRLFTYDVNRCCIPESKKSVLVSSLGWKKDYSWRKLYNKLPNHESSSNHKKCYVKWRELERNLNQGTDIASKLDAELETKTRYWKDLLQRILSVVIFLAERGLAFTGSSKKIGDQSNGNFLGLIELLAKYDPVLREHVTKVKQSQEHEKRLPAHYLSPESQNEFIEACSARVLQAILEERKISKYYSILADSTPDFSHSEQTTFVLRYLVESHNEFKIVERFLNFVNCNKKTGKDMADLIINELKKHNIPLSECRGQGYDNGANMAGVYNGAQAIIRSLNPKAEYSNCGGHSLNLCGANAAESCEEAVTFFGIVQKTYNFFSRSPQRWEIVQSKIGCSLHSTSKTRWSARVESVKPFVHHLPLIQQAFHDCKTLNLSSECRIDLNAIINYINTFKCTLIATIWLKILVAVDLRNRVIQARNATLDVEVKNIESLIQELKSLRNQWPQLLSEAKLVAQSVSSKFPCEVTFPEKRSKKRKVFHDEAEDTPIEPLTSENQEERNFRVNVFYRIIDSVISGLAERFETATKINSIFECLWNYEDLSDADLEEKSKLLLDNYPDDLGSEFQDELQYLRSIHRSNLGETKLKPLHLLNKLKLLKLDKLFPNVCIAVRIFCTIPVTVAEAERTFSKMKLIKNVLRSTMGQDRMSGLNLLATETDLVKDLSFSDIISDFASKKARRIAF